MFPLARFVPDGADVLDEIGIAAVTKNGAPRFLSFREYVQHEVPVGLQRRMPTHVARLHAGSDEAVLGEVVCSVAAIAAERLTKNERAADQLPKPYDVEV